MTLCLPACLRSVVGCISSAAQTAWVKSQVQDAGCRHLVQPVQHAGIKEIACACKSAWCAQVCLLAEGHLMFFGPPDDAAPWFGSVGYMYSLQAGLVSDWMLDLVSISFQKPAQPGVCGHVHAGCSRLWHLLGLFTSLKSFV